MASFNHFARVADPPVSAEDSDYESSDSDDPHETARQLEMAREERQREEEKQVRLDESIQIIGQGVAPMKFPEAMQALQEDAVTTLCLAGEDLYEAGGKTLARALAKAPSLQALQITTVHLPHNGLSDSGLRHVVESLKTNTIATLHTLILDHCNITHVGAADVAAKLVQYNATLTRLSLNANNIESAGCGAICGVLVDGAGIRDLSLAGNEITSDGIMQLARLLANGCPLVSLDLSENDLGDAGIGLLARVMAANTNLKRLNLAQNNIGEEGAKYLASMLELAQGLEELDVSRNSFTGDADAVLSEALASNHSLTKLNMHSCKLDDDGAFAFAAMLETNTTLKYVDLRGNYISPDGLHRLTGAMKTNKTMLKLEVFDASEKSSTQALLNKFCIRNGLAQRVREPPSRVTARDLEHRLGWNAELVTAWVERVSTARAVNAFRGGNVDGGALVRMGVSELKALGVEPHEVRRELMEQINHLKIELETRIRHDRGENPEQEDEDERMLRAYAPPERLTHVQRMQHQKDRNVQSSGLERLKEVLAREQAQEDAQ